MNLELYLQNSNDGTIYNISEIAEEIEISDNIDGEASKLTTILQQDPNNILKISNGSIISFIVDGKGFFFGYVFKVGTDADNNYKITAYDQLRYFKNNDIMTTQNQTASNIFATICSSNNMKYNIKAPTSYIPEPYVHDKKTYYAIVKRGMNLASLYDNKRYFIRDDFGTLTWSELGLEKTNIILGDNSLIYSYTYEKSIDSDVYNQIKMYRDNEETGKRDIWIVKDSDNMKRWGLLQYLEKADNDANAEQVRQSAENYLKKYNKEKETLKMEADGIIELRAGRGIKFELEKLGFSKWMWIINSKHRFTKYQHTMELEVEV